MGRHPAPAAPPLDLDAEARLLWDEYHEPLAVTLERLGLGLVSLLAARAAEWLPPASRTVVDHLVAALARLAQLAYARGTRGIVAPFAPWEPGEQP